MMRFLRKLTKFGMWLVLGSLLILAMLGSQPGLHVLKFSAPTLVPGLQIGTLTGSLWQGVQLSQFSYQSDALTLQIQEANVRLGVTCLLAKSLCIETATLQGVDIQHRTVTPLEEPTTEFRWPLNFQLNNLAVQNLRATTSSASVQLDSLQIKTLSNINELAALTLESPHLAGLRLDSAPAKTKKTTSTSRDMAAELQEFLAITLPFALEIADAKLTDFRWYEHNRLQWQTPTLAFSAVLSKEQWQLSALQIDNATPKFTAALNASLDKTTPAIALTVTAAMNGQQLQATAQGPLAAVQLEGRVHAASAPAIALTSTLNLSTLQYQGQISAENLAGWLPTPANAEPMSIRGVEINFSGDLKTTTIEANAQTKLPNLPNADVKLAALWQFKSQRLEVTQLELLTLNGKISGHGFFDVNQQQLDLQLALAQLLPGLYWVDYPGMIQGNLQASVQLKPSMQIALSAINIQGELRDRPLTMTGDVHLVQQVQDAKAAKAKKTSTPEILNTGVDFASMAATWHLHAKQLVLQHGPNTLKADGDLAKQWQLAVALNVVDLSYSLALAEGQMQANFTMSGSATHPLLVGNFNAQKLSYLDDYSLETLAIDGTFTEWGQQPSRLTIVANQGQAPDYQLQKFEWRADGTLAQHQSIVLLDSHQIQLAATYQGAWTGERWQALINEFRFNADVGDWQLQAPLSITLDRKKQLLSVAESCWQSQPATVCIRPKGPLSQRSGQIDIAMTQLDLQAFDTLFPATLSLTGRVNGSTGVMWKQGKLTTVNYQLQGDAGSARLQTNTLLEIPWQHMQLNGKLVGSTFDNQLQLRLNDTSRFDTQFALSQLDQASPQINATLKLDPYSLKFLQPLMNEWTQFDGKTSLDLRLTGSALQPQVTGKIVFDDLVMTGKQAPIELKPSSVALEFLGYQSLLTGVLVTPEGDLTIKGQGNWRDLTSWSTRLDIQSPLLKLNLMDADISMSPDLSFTANPLGGEIRGLIKIPRADLKFDSLPENAIRVSDDEVIISADVAKANKSNWTLSSDVKLQMGEQVRLAAFGLKTRLEGELRVRQNGLTPTIHGTVHLKDGNFRAYGQDLQLRKGRLIFNGQAEQPMLAIEAIRNPEKTEDDVIAGLRVNGLADNPVVEVFSEPGKPQANALAYLLLGRDIGSSAGDGSLTAGLIGIGIANSGKLVGKLGEAFGVSDLSLDTAGSGDSSKVTVSGYLSPKLQIKYGVGIFNQLGEFTLRYRLMKQLYVEGVTGVANSVDLLYKMEFN